MVSGGRGTLGECGGINNPVHYVRYVFFLVLLSVAPVQAPEKLKRMLEFCSVFG